MSTTLILIAITVVVSIIAFRNHELFFKWIMNPHAVASENQYYRFISSGFIHADYVHLGFNMFTFYFFGNTVEYFFEIKTMGFGTPTFVVFYLLSITVSEIPSYFKNRDNPRYNSLGASGGVSAVVFASIMIAPTNMLYIYAILPIPGFVLGFLYLVYSYYMGKKGDGKINHDAHFYGALFGIVFTVVLDPGILISFYEQILTFDFVGMFN